MQYLCSSYEIDEVEYKMADVFPANTRMTNKLKALGHTKAESSGEFINGTLLGHEFHYSTTECSRDAKLEYEMIRGKGIEDGKDGLSEHNSIASYMHAHPATFPVNKFVDMCRKYSRR
jgi:cobyrinic acid a,c-diamide synthase